MESIEFQINHFFERQNLDCKKVWRKPDVVILNTNEIKNGTAPADDGNDFSTIS